MSKIFVRFARMAIFLLSSNAKSVTKDAKPAWTAQKCVCHAWRVTKWTRSLVINVALNAHPDVYPVSNHEKIVKFVSQVISKLVPPASPVPMNARLVLAAPRTARAVSLTD